MVLQYALNTMYFENTGHLGRAAEVYIQSIFLNLPRFPVNFEDVILSDPAHMSGFEFQGTVLKVVYSIKV